MWKTTIPITILKVDISYKETSIKLEIESVPELKIGTKVNSRSHIANIVQILKHPPNKRVEGHSMFMLHVELLKKDAMDSFAGDWNHNENKHEYLKDPSIYLFNPNN